MLILATVFQCVDPMLTIAACLSSKPVFLNPIDKRDEATQYDETSPPFTHRSELSCPPQSSGTLYDSEKRPTHRRSRVRRMYANTPRRHTQRHASILYRCTRLLPIPILVPPTYCEYTQNYISATTIRDITVLRNDLLSALTSSGLVPVGQRASSPELNVHSTEPALLKALLLAALYPRVARIALPRHAVKFARLASGTVARDVSAHEWRATDMRGGQRVWVHPASVLFTETRWRSGIVVSFERVETAGTGKVYLRDVTEVRVSCLIYSYFFFICDMYVCFKC
jgi:ATP-dependent RNA helicase DHX57